VKARNLNTDHNWRHRTDRNINLAVNLVIAWPVCEQSVPKFVCDQAQNDPLISLYKSHTVSKEHALTLHKNRGTRTDLSALRCSVTYQHTLQYKAHICALLYELQCTYVVRKVKNILPYICVHNIFAIDCNKSSVNFTGSNVFRLQKLNHASHLTISRI